MAHLVAAHAEIPLRIRQPRTARADKRDAAKAHARLARRDHDIMRVVRVIVSRRRRRRARRREHRAKARVARVPERQPHRRGKIRPRALRRPRHLAERHFRPVRGHIIDQRSQRRIAHHLAGEVGKIHADDQQLLRPLRAGTLRNHAAPRITARHSLRAGRRVERAERVARAAEKCVVGAIPIHHHLIARRARHHTRGRAHLCARLQIRDLDRLQHAARQFRERQFPIERDALHRDIRASRHRVAQSVRERGKCTPIAHRDRALHRQHREPLPRRWHRRDHGEITASGNRLLKLRHDIRRQLPPHRRRHREFQRALRILIDEIRHLIPPLLGQRAPFAQECRLFLSRPRARKTIRPIAEPREHRFLHGQLPSQILPHRQRHLRRHFTRCAHRARSRHDRCHFRRLLRCGRKKTWRRFFRSRR